MGSVAALLPNKSEIKTGFRKIFFFVCATGWLFFVFSSFEYKNQAWFPILLSGRLCLLISAIFFYFAAWFHKALWPNLEVAFLLCCLAFQSLCGILEGSNSTEFTNFMSVFIIIAPVFHCASQRAWAYRLFPFMCVLIILPFFFKSGEFFSSIGAFTDQFSAVVSSTLVGFLIGRATAVKNEALLHATQLQEELTKERDQQKQLIEHQARELANSRVTARIAEATQMVAHDVRRPFSMLRTAIDLIRNAKSPDQVLIKATSLIRDVEDSLNDVDNLISDIITISNQEPLKIFPTKPESLLQDVIQDTLKQHPDAEIEFEFSLQHSKKIAIDENKIRRVVSNILTNAFQAMNNHGIISISTSDKELAGRHTIEISIHNSGPPIAAKDIPHIFDSFFTRGKQGGTGLGLAIAKTFVDAHSGEIGCSSSENHGVRFYFSFAAVGEPYNPLRPMINRSKLVVEEKCIASLPHNTPNESAMSSSEKKEFRILVIEDELIFQQGILNVIERFSTHEYKIISYLAHNESSAHKLIEDQKPDLILLDIDLGPSSRDGMHILQKIRAQGLKTFVCIHSNRTFFDTGFIPEALGADIAIPKPMTAENFGLIISAALKKSFSELNKPKVVVVDDEDCYLIAWKEAMIDAEVMTFSDPEVFWDEVIEKPLILQNISCIILDFYFRGSDVEKLQLVGSLRSRGFCGPIILSTNAAYNDAHRSEKNGFDYIMQKRAISFSDLKKIPQIACAIKNTKKE